MVSRSPIFDAVRSSSAHGAGLAPFDPDLAMWRSAPPSVLVALASDWCHPETGEPVGPLAALSWAERDLDRRRVAAALSRASLDAVVDESGRVVKVAESGEIDGIRASMVGVDHKDRLVTDEAHIVRNRPERYRVVRVDLGDDDAGEWRGRLILGGRDIRADWLASPEASAKQVGRCGTGGGVVSLPDGGGFRGIAYGCKSPMCPQCGHGRAVSAVDHYLPTVMELAKMGCVILHVTRTQRTRPMSPAEGVDPRPVLLTREERRRGYWSPQHGTGAGWAVQGESLDEGLARYNDAVRELRNRDTASSDWWDRWAVGSVHGCEYTGHDLITMKGGHKLRRPRWHVHGHELLILPPEAAELLFEVDDEDCDGKKRVEGELWREYVEHWMRISDGGSLGQKARWIRGDEAEIRSALTEVLKYPYKTADLTDAQVIEAIAVTKGRKLHNPSGALHQSSTIATIVRWSDQAIDGDKDAAVRRGFAWWKERLKVQRDVPATRSRAVRAHEKLQDVEWWPLTMPDDVKGWVSECSPDDQDDEYRTALDRAQQWAWSKEWAKWRRWAWNSEARRRQRKIDALPCLTKVADALLLARQVTHRPKARLVYTTVDVGEQDPKDVARWMDADLSHPIAGYVMSVWVPLDLGALARLVLTDPGASMAIGEWCSESASIVDKRRVSVNEVWADVASWRPPTERLDQ